MVRNILNGLDVKFIKLHSHLMLQVNLQIIEEDCDVVMLILNVELIKVLIELVVVD